jgi:hypothetical protein
MSEQAVGILPPALTRARARVLELSPAWQLTAWWLASRGIVFGCAALLHWLRTPRGYFHPEFASVVDILKSWDGRWYDEVAANGYLLIPGHQSDPAFFPLYPVLLRLGGHLGISHPATGIVISNLLLLVGVLVFYRLGQELLPDGDAYRAAVFVTIAPMGFTFSMVYPESLVFTAMALAGLAALRGRWLACAAFAATAALGRPQGALIVIPIAAAAWHAWSRLAPRDRGFALGAVAAPLAALLSYPLYLQDILGDPHAWSKTQHAWGRAFHIDGFLKAFGQLPARNGTDHWILRDAIFCLAYVLLLAVALWAGVPLGWIVAGALMVLLPLETGSFISVARFGLLALPVFWGLGVLGRRRSVDWALRLICVGLLVALTMTMPLIFP